MSSSEASVAVFDEERLTPLRRLQRFLHGNPTVVPALVLLAGVIGFSARVGDRFFDPFNLSLIVQQVTIVGIIAVGQTLIILTAGIDLSVGAIMVLSSVVMGRLAVEWGLPLFVAIPGGLLIGAFAGAINGTLTTVFRLPPFIVTLGTWNMFYALDLWYSRSNTIRAQEVEEAAPFLQWLGLSVDFFGARLTVGSLLMLSLVTLTWYVLNRTPFGRHVYATGDDPDAARLAGIRTDRVLIAVYVLAGVICAIAGWAMIGRIGSVSPLAGSTSNLDSITAVVIGGTSLFGGRGSIFGTLIGALIVGVFRNGLALAGLDVLWQEFTVGLLIIVAVTFDQWIRRVSA